jgi:hypothetical protein
MNETDKQALIAQARAELADHIDVPVYRTEVDPNPLTVTFYLYGGQARIWFAPQPEPAQLPPRLAGGTEGGPPPDTGPKDQARTVAAGIGTKTAKALNRLEITNLRQLARAIQDQDPHVRELFNQSNWLNLCAWLDQHGFFA